MVFLTCQSFSRFISEVKRQLKTKFQSDVLSQGVHNISLAEASCTERVSEVFFDADADADGDCSNPGYSLSALFLAGPGTAGQAKSC